MKGTIVCLQRKDRIKRGGRLITQIKRIVYEVNESDIKIFERWYKEHKWERMFFEFPRNIAIKCELVDDKLERMTVNKIASGWIDVGEGAEIQWH